MSPWPSDATATPSRHALRRAGPWPERLRRATRRIVGREPAATVLIEREGVLAWPAQDDRPPTRHATFADWCGGAGTVDARLVVSAHLLHSLAFAGVSGSDAGALRDAAARSFAHYHGRPAELWTIAAAAGEEQAFACALHDFDLAAALASATAHGVVPKSVVPLWAEALPAAIARAPALAGADVASLNIVEGRLVTCLDLRSGRLVGVQQRHLDVADTEAFADLLDRRRLESNGAACLAFAVGWGMEGDFEQALAGSCRQIGRVDGRAEASAWLAGARPGAA